MKGEREELVAAQICAEEIQLSCVVVGKLCMLCVHFNRMC